MAFKKALIERALGAELSHHLGYPPGAEKPGERSNHRNGISSKAVLTENGPLRIQGNRTLTSYPQQLTSSGRARRPIANPSTCWGLTTAE